MVISQTVAVVTGANRGIGLAICQSLANTFSRPLVLYALTRKGTDLGLQPSSGDIKIRYAKFSLTSESSTSAIAEKINEEHGGCDVLINNAGVYYFKENITPNERKETLDVNYRGTLKTCLKFIPIMKSDGRIVNLSSQSGLLKYYASSIAKRFLACTTLEEVEQLVQEYDETADNGNETRQGWPSMTYFVSKTALNTVTRILAQQNPDIFVNCCCPGWVDTDLGSQAGRPPKTVEQGAMIPLRLGFGDISGISGRYWSNKDVYDTGHGEVQNW